MAPFSRVGIQGVFDKMTVISLVSLVKTKVKLPRGFYFLVAMKRNMNDKYAWVDGGEGGEEP